MAWRVAFLAPLFLVVEALRDESVCLQTKSSIDDVQSPATCTPVCESNSDQDPADQTWSCGFPASDSRLRAFDTDTCLRALVESTIPPSVQRDQVTFWVAARALTDWNETKLISLNMTEIHDNVTNWFSGRIGLQQTINFETYRQQIADTQLWDAQQGKMRYLLDDILRDHYCENKEFRAGHSENRGVWTPRGVGDASAKSFTSHVMQNYNKCLKDVWEWYGVPCNTATSPNTCSDHAAAQELKMGATRRRRNADDTTLENTRRRRNKVQSGSANATNLKFCAPEWCRFMEDFNDEYKTLNYNRCLFAADGNSCPAFERVKRFFDDDGCLTSLDEFKDKYIQKVWGNPAVFGVGRCATTPQFLLHMCGYFFGYAPEYLNVDEYATLTAVRSYDEKCCMFMENCGSRSSARKCSNRTSPTGEPAYPCSDAAHMQLRSRGSSKKARQEKLNLLSMGAAR